MRKCMEFVAAGDERMKQQQPLENSLNEATKKAPFEHLQHLPLSVTPQTFHFAPGVSKTVRIFLENFDESASIAFKLKSKHPHLYIIKPHHSGIVTSKSTVWLDVSLSPAIAPLVFVKSRKDRFLLQCRVLDVGDAKDAAPLRVTQRTQSNDGRDGEEEAITAGSQSVEGEPSLLCSVVLQHSPSLSIAREPYEARGKSPSPIRKEQREEVSAGSTEHSSPSRPPAGACLSRNLTAAAVAATEILRNTNVPSKTVEGVKDVSPSRSRSSDKTQLKPRQQTKELLQPQNSKASCSLLPKMGATAHPAVPVGTPPDVQPGEPRPHYSSSDSPKRGERSHKKASSPSPHQVTSSARALQSKWIVSASNSPRCSRCGSVGCTHRRIRPEVTRERLAQLEQRTLYSHIKARKVFSGTFFSEQFMRSTVERDEADEFFTLDQEFRRLRDFEIWSSKRDEMIKSTPMKPKPPTQQNPSNRSSAPKPLRVEPQREYESSSVAGVHSGGTVSSPEPPLPLHHNPSAFQIGQLENAELDTRNAILKAAEEDFVIYFKLIQKIAALHISKQEQLEREVIVAEGMKLRKNTRAVVLPASSASSAPQPPAPVGEQSLQSLRHSKDLGPTHSGLALHNGTLQPAKTKSTPKKTPPPRSSFPANRTPPSYNVAVHSCEFCHRVGHCVEECSAYRERNVARWSEFLPNWKHSSVSPQPECDTEMRREPSPSRLVQLLALLVTISWILLEAFAFFMCAYNFLTQGSRISNPLSVGPASCPSTTKQPNVGGGLRL